jgi:hypothetical protein
LDRRLSGFRWFLSWQGFNINTGFWCGENTLKRLRNFNQRVALEASLLCYTNLGLLKYINSSLVYLFSKRLVT